MMNTTINRRSALQNLGRALAVVALSAVGSHSAYANDDDFRIGGRPGRGWQLLGEVSAGKRVDRDEIRASRSGAYTAIRLVVRNAPVEFFTIRIQFRNGESRELEVRQSVPRGGATRVIDLPGERRLIERVVFWYKTPPRATQQARVQLWARR